MIILPDAQVDLENAVDWYERQRGGLGAAFLLAMEETFDRISRTPELHPIMHRNVRRALTRQFPYPVYYFTEPDAVLVLGIFHVSRDPREWQLRA